MTTFTVDITDTHQLAGIAAARAAYNANVPPNADGTPGAQIATDADYVQFVMGMAADSYAKQYGT